MNRNEKTRGSHPFLIFETSSDQTHSGSPSCRRFLGLSRVEHNRKGKMPEWFQIDGSTTPDGISSQSASTSKNERHPKVLGVFLS